MGKYLEIDDGFMQQKSKISASLILEFCSVADHSSAHTHTELVFVLLSCWNPDIAVKKLLTPRCSLLSVPTPPYLPLSSFSLHSVLFVHQSLFLLPICAPPFPLAVLPAHVLSLTAVRIKPGSTSPVEYQSDSDAESGTESGSASLSVQSLDAG